MLLEAMRLEASRWGNGVRPKASRQAGRPHSAVEVRERQRFRWEWGEKGACNVGMGFEDGG